MTRFAGRVAIVTGAGSGLGRATALRLASEGAATACLGGSCPLGRLLLVLALEHRPRLAFGLIFGFGLTCGLGLPAPDPGGWARWPSPDGGGGDLHRWRGLHNGVRDLSRRGGNLHGGGRLRLCRSRLAFRSRPPWRGFHGCLGHLWRHAFRALGDPYSGRTPFGNRHRLGSRGRGRGRGSFGLRDGLGGGGGGHAEATGGGGGFADNVVNSALRFRAQAPLVDQLLREIGVDSGDVGKAARGLLDRGTSAVLPAAGVGDVTPE